MQLQASTTRLLLLEDSDIDAVLLMEHLRRGPRTYAVDRAMRRSDFEAALRRPAPDLVLADYSLPDFDGLAALKLSRQTWPHVPFVFVSGVLGEDIAMEAMREGATDYVLKRNLASLGPVVERALAEAHERRNRERAEMLFRMASEAAGIGVWELDIQAQALHFDEGMRAVLGLGRQALDPLPRMVELLVHEDDREAVRGHLARASSADADAEFEYMHRIWHQRSGSHRWLGVKGRRVSGPDGRLLLVGTARDVTAERQRDDALVLANESLEEQVVERQRERDRIWNLSTDLMHVCRADGTLLEVNPAWPRLLGWTNEELLSTNFVDWVDPQDEIQTQRALANLTRSPTVPAFEIRMRRADGDVRWVRWSATGDQGRIYAVGRDVAEQRDALEKLAIANRDLKAQVAERGQMEATLQQMQRLEAVGQLTSGVAHDFNNLLAVVLSNINLIRLVMARQANASDPRIPQRLQSMQAAAERGAKLVQQLMAFSRRQRLEPSVIDLNEVLHGMRDLLQSTLGGTIAIDTDLHAPLWHALVDPTQLELIVLNLAINARDAMPVGGRLIIRTANVTLGRSSARPEGPDSGSYVQLTVSDTGAGIASDVLGRVFEPFFTTKDVGKGSGLGLAQVYGFAKQSGGGVEIETRVGKGTSVHVYVPRATGAADQPEAVPAELGRTQALDSHFKVLLVDDDPDVRDVMAQLMIEHGFDVLEAEGGLQALELLASDGKDIDLVLADFAMPGMNGAELRRRLLRARPELRVAIVTGYADLSALKDVPEDMVLQKPLAFDRLLDLIDTWAHTPPARPGPTRARMQG